MAVEGTDTARARTFSREEKQQLYPWRNCRQAHKQEDSYNFTHIFIETIDVLNCRQPIGPQVWQFSVCAEAKRLWKDQRVKHYLKKQQQIVQTTKSDFTSEYRKCSVDRNTEKLKLSSRIHLQKNSSWHSVRKTVSEAKQRDTPRCTHLKSVH